MQLRLPHLFIRYDSLLVSGTVYRRPLRARLTAPCSPLPWLSLVTLTILRSYSQHNPHSTRNDEYGKKRNKETRKEQLPDADFEKLPKNFGAPLGPSGPARKRKFKGEKFTVEASLDDESIRKYKHFWHSFAERAEEWKDLCELSEKAANEMLAHLNEELTRVQSGLVCEVSSGRLFPSLAQPFESS